MQQHIFKVERESLDSPFFVVREYKNGKRMPGKRGDRMLSFVEAEAWADKLRGAYACATKEPSLLGGCL